MSSSFPTIDHYDVRGLARAMEQNTSPEGLNFGLTPAQWNILTNYLQPFNVAPGTVLIEQGDLDCSLYLVESGTLSVHYEDEKSRIRLAMVAAGSVVGESGFFSHLARAATVQAAGSCVLWRLNPVRFGELANRQPAIAVQMLLSVGAVLARRFKDRPRRIAST